jgi:hypothetical protein
MPHPITVPSIGARSMAVPADGPGGRAAEPAPLPDPADLFSRAWQAVWHLVTAAPVLPVLTAVTVLLAVAAGAVAGRAVDSRRRHAGARLLAVRPPAAVDAAGGEVLWRTMLGLHRPVWRRALLGQPHVAVELSADADGPRLAVWVPGGVPPGLVEHALTAAWPGTRVDDGPAVPPVPLSGTSTGGALRLASPGWYPLRTRHEVDPARPLLAALSALQAGETACVQVLARPASRHRARKARSAAAKLRNPGRGSTGWAGWAGELTDLAALTSGGSGGRRSGGRSGGRVGFGWVDPWLADDLRAVKDKTAQPLFEVAIRYAAVTQDSTSSDSARRDGSSGDGDRTGFARRQPQARVRGLADGVASAFGAHTGRNRLARQRIRLRHAAQVLAGRRLRRGFLLSVTELAAVAHLPYDTLLPGLEASAARRVAPLPRVPTTGKVLGDADAGPARPVAMTVVDSRTHVHVLGETGSGKSTLLAQLILGDADAGRGVLAVDPQGDMINDILDRLPTAALDRLVIIDPDDPAPPPSLNILDGPDLDLVADHAVGIMSRLFSAWWGPRTDDILRAAVLTLRDPSNDRRPDLRTLAAVPTLLTEPAFRRRATAGLTDPVLRGFWSDYDTQSDAARVQAAGPLLNKLRAVLLRPFVRDTLAAGPSTVDMQKVLDGGMCLVRLPKGSLGEDAARLLGSFLLARVWQTATHRARTGRAARIDCSVYLDECQNFLNLPHALDDMLAEARGYRLSLVLAHQHLGQLGPDLADGVSANARSKIFFTTSPEDARRLERHVAPRLAAHDLAHLDGYQAAARLLVDNRRTPAFTLRTRPLGPPIPGRAAAARAAAARNTTAHTADNLTEPPGTPVRPGRAESTGTGTTRSTRPRITGVRAAASGGGGTGTAHGRTRPAGTGPRVTSQSGPAPRSDRRSRP